MGTGKKAAPLPSVLSSIRRAGAVVRGGIAETGGAISIRSPKENDASFTAAERESFLKTIATADGPIAMPHHHQHQRKFKPFEMTASGDFGFRGKDRKDATGKKFRVQIPQKMLFYVALVFFVIPLLSAIIVLFRKLSGEETNHDLSHGVVSKFHDAEMQAVLHDGEHLAAEDMSNLLLSSEPLSNATTIETAEVMSALLGEKKEKEEKIVKVEEHSLDDPNNKEQDENTSIQDGDETIQDDDENIQAKESNDRISSPSSNASQKNGNISKNDQKDATTDEDEIKSTKKEIIATASGNLDAQQIKTEEVEKETEVDEIERQDKQKKSDEQQKQGGSDSRTILRGGHLKSQSQDGT